MLNRIPPQAPQVVAAVSAVTSSEKPAVVEELIIPAPQHAAPQTQTQTIQEEPLPQTDIQPQLTEKTEEAISVPPVEPLADDSSLTKRAPDTDTKQETATQDPQVQPSE